MNKHSFEPNDQDHGHINDIVYDDVIRIGTNVHIYMKKH